jgi:CDP-4-dehydro-6-deoxyglucose reductase
MIVYNCKIKDVIQLNDQIYRIRIVPDDLRLLEFKGGQYIVLHMPDGKRVPLSIASAPEEKTFLELHIRIVQEYSLADDMIKLFQGAPEVKIEGAFGSCYLNDSQRGLVIIAGGTGFSPMKSMIESAFAQKCERPIELFLGAQVMNDLYHHDLISEWQKSYNNFRYTPVISGDDEIWDGAVGFPHEVAIERCNKELVEKDFYVSGSEAMVMAVYRALTDKGVDSSQINSDILNIKREKGEID